MSNKGKKLLVDVLSMTKGELVDAICELEEQLNMTMTKDIDERDKLLEENDKLKAEIESLKPFKEKADYWRLEFTGLYDFVQAGVTITETGNLEADEPTLVKAIELTREYETGSKIKPPSRQLGFSKYHELKKGRSDK